MTKIDNRKSSFVGGKLCKEFVMYLLKAG